jgi:hypothetical protein
VECDFPLSFVGRIFDPKNRFPVFFSSTESRPPAPPSFMAFPGLKEIASNLFFFSTVVLKPDMSMTFKKDVSEDKISGYYLLAILYYR